MKMKRCLSLFMSILLLISLCSVGYFSASAGSWNYGTGYSEDDDGNLIISDNVDNTAAWQETFDASKGFLAGYQIHFNSTMFNSTHFVRNTNSDEGIFMRLQRHPESGVGYRFIMQGSVNRNWTNELVRTDIDCDDDTVQVVLLHAKGSDELTVRVNNEFGMTLYSTTLNVGTVGAAPGWFDGFNELRVGGEVVYGDNSGETHQAVVSAVEISADPTIGAGWTYQSPLDEAEIAKGNYRVKYDGETIVENTWGGFTRYNKDINTSNGFTISYDVQVDSPNGIVAFIRNSNIQFFEFPIIVYPNNCVQGIQVNYNADGSSYINPAQNISINTNKLRVTIERPKYSSQLVYTIRDAATEEELFTQMFALSDFSNSDFFNGEVHFMIGSNGAGASTFSNIVVEESKADVTINGSSTVTAMDMVNYEAVYTGENSLSTCNWTLYDKDNQVLTTGSSGAFNYIFAKPGSYTLKLVATDADSHVISATKKIIVSSVAQNNWTLGSNWVAYCDANNKLVLSADNTNSDGSFSTFNGSVYGDEGFDLAWDIDFSACVTRGFSCQLISTGGGVVALQIYPDRNADQLSVVTLVGHPTQGWSPTYTYGTNGRISFDADELRVRLTHEAGTDTMNVIITSTDGTKTYLSEVLNDNEFYYDEMFESQFRVAMICEPGSVITLDDIVGLEIYEKDMHSEPYQNVLFLGGDTLATADWQTALIEQIGVYQAQEVEKVLTSASEIDDADLIVLYAGALDANQSTEEFAAKMEQELTKITAGKKDDAVVLVVNIPALAGEGDDTKLVNQHADKNGTLRALANEYGAVYANVFSETAAAAWAVDDQDIISNAVFSVLAEYSSCLLKSYGQDAPLVGPAPRNPGVGVVRQAIAAFKELTDVSQAREAIEEGKLNLKLEAWYKLSESLQIKVAEAMLKADKTEWVDAASVQTAFDRILYAVRLSNLNTDKSPERFKNVVFIGDSITWGACASDHNTTAWAPLLHSMLEKAIGTDITYINEGISGTLLTGWSGNGAFGPANLKVQEDIIDNDPDLLLLAYGINDMNSGVSVEALAAAYDSYLAEIRKALPDTTIVVVGLTYMGNDGGGERVRANNSNLRRLAEKYGAIYADVYNMLYGSEWLLADNLHPTDIGYKVMANTIYNAIADNCNLKDVDVSDDTTGTDDPASDEDSEADNVQTGLGITAIVLSLVLAAVSIAVISVVYFTHASRTLL